MKEHSIQINVLWRALPHVEHEDTCTYSVTHQEETKDGSTFDTVPSYVSQEVVDFPKAPVLLGQYEFPSVLEPCIS